MLRFPPFRLKLAVNFPRKSEIEEFPDGRFVSPDPFKKRDS